MTPHARDAIGIVIAIVLPAVLAWCVARAAFAQSSAAPPAVGGQGMHAGSGSPLDHARRAASGGRPATDSLKRKPRAAAQSVAAAPTPPSSLTGAGAGGARASAVESTSGGRRAGSLRSPLERGRRGAALERDDIESELVRVWVAEGGWRAYRAHAAMAHVLRRHALRRSWTLQESIDAEVWAHSNALRDRPWLRGLSATCERPARWPWRRWPSHLCERLAMRADKFVRGQLPDPCPQARGWRSVGRALDKAMARGFVRVRCGVTAPAFVRWA